MVSFPCDFVGIVVVMQIQSKLVSSEPGFAPHDTGISAHDLNIQLNNCLRFQITQCTYNKDTKKSVNLCDIPLDPSQN